MSHERDEASLRMQQLMNDYNNIRQSQQSYGVPTIGDLFKNRPDDIDETGVFQHAIHILARAADDEVAVIGTEHAEQFFER